MILAKYLDFEEENLTNCALINTFLFKPRKIHPTCIRLNHF